MMLAGYLLRQDSRAEHVALEPRGAGRPPEVLGFAQLCQPLPRFPAADNAAGCQLLDAEAGLVAWEQGKALGR